MRLLKMLVDILSAFAIPLPFAVMIYIYTYYGHFARLPGKWPAWTLYLVAACIIFLISVIWLSVRYGKWIKTNAAYVLTVEFRVILALSAFILTFIVMTVLRFAN